MTKPDKEFDEALAEAIIDKYGTNKVSVTEVESALDWAKWAREWLLKDACTNSRGGIIQRARKDLIEENAKLKAELEFWRGLFPELRDKAKRPREKE